MPPSILIADRLAEHVRRGHPWLYRDVLPPGAFPARTGDIVEVRSKENKVLGRALFDAESPIALRLLTTRPSEGVDRALILRRVAQAWSLRHATLDLSLTTGFRVVHGEGDRLPGVVVDRYAGFLVVKLDTPAWLPHLPLLVEALQEVIQPQGIYLKGVLHAEESVSGARVLAGEAPPDEIVIFESGIKLAVDVIRGQKTGFFLDQRDNRAVILRCAHGRNVLNLFSYTGGFSLAAACGGATRVTSVDIARGAVEGARRNLGLNGFDPEQHGLVVADAFDYLTDCATHARQFDLVIVDPPSFAPSERVVKRALHAYTRLNTRAIRQVTPGGLLAASSCSSHVSLEDFVQSLRESAAEARRIVRVLEVRTEPADHPVPLHFPEGKYLKFVLAVVE